MQTDDPMVKSLSAGYDAGAAWVTGLKPGDVFFGCRPAAEAAFPNDKLAQDIFVSVSYAELKRWRIVCERDTNVIISIQK